MRKIPLEILLLRGSSGILLEPELAWGSAQQRDASARGFVGEHMGNPDFKGSSVPGEAARGRAGPGPSPPAAPGRRAERACSHPRSLAQGLSKPGVLSPDRQQGPPTQHCPCTIPLPPLPTAPPGQTPRLRPPCRRKDPLLPPDRAFLLQPARGLLNRRRKTHCDFKQTQRAYRIWRETIFSSAAQSPHWAAAERGFSPPPPWGLVKKSNSPPSPREWAAPSGPGRQPSPSSPQRGQQGGRVRGLLTAVAVRKTCVQIYGHARFMTSTKIPERTRTLDLQ